MKRKINTFIKRISILLAVILIFSTASPVCAQETGKSGDRSEELNAYIRELLASLDSADTEMSEISGLIAEIDSNIETNSDQLRTQEAASLLQEQSMKKRIKYLYESGNDFNMIEAMLSADSIGDALNRTSYISKIVDYDREMMDRYIETIDTINRLQSELKDNRQKLVNLQENYNQKGIELSAIVAEVPEKMAELGVEKEEIGQVIEEYIRDNPEPETLEPETESEPLSEPQSEPEQEEEPENTTTEQPEPVTEKESGPETTTEEETTTEPETTTQEETTTEPEPETTTEEPTTAEPEPAATGSPNDDPVWNLARITYLENGVMYPESSYKSIYLTACVVINRANAWYGGSIMDSIYAPGAYATAYKYDDWTGGELVINDITWQAVNEALANPDPNVFYQCNGSWLEGNGLKEYYRDPVTDEVFYYLN